MNRLLPKRLQGITDEVAKFGVIGLINLVVNLAAYNILLRTWLESGEVKAKAVATIVATTCAYFMNRYWTYRDRPKSTLRREYVLFLLFNAVGLVIEVAVVWLAKYGFHQSSNLVFNICTIIGIVLGTIFRFWAYRTHVFKKHHLADEPVLVTAAAALATVPDPAMEQTDEDDDGQPAQRMHGRHRRHVRDDALHAELDQIELDQIELDRIVAGEQTPTRRTP
jgi:putative flippase GtrA